MFFFFFVAYRGAGAGGLWCSGMTLRVPRGIHSIILLLFVDYKGYLADGGGGAAGIRSTITPFLSTINWPWRMGAVVLRHDMAVGKRHPLDNSPVFFVDYKGSRADGGGGQAGIRSTNIMFLSTIQGPRRMGLWCSGMTLRVARGIRSTIPMFFVDYKRSRADG